MKYALIFALLLLATGCTHAVPVPPPPPTPPPAPGPAISFRAEAATIVQGKSVTLDWTTTGKSNWVSPDVGEVTAEGALVVNPQVSTTYTLTATGPTGTNTATVTITVTAAPPLPAIVPGCGANTDNLLCGNQGDAYADPVIPNAIPDIMVKPKSMEER